MRNAATELLSGAEFDGGYELQPSGSTGLHECVWRVSPNPTIKMWRPPKRAPPNDEDLSIRRHFRSRLARFQLRTHFLNLSGLLFELSCESRYLFL